MKEQLTLNRQPLEPATEQAQTHQQEENNNQEEQLQEQEQEQNQQEWNHNQQDNDFIDPENYISGMAKAFNPLPTPEEQGSENQPLTVNISSRPEVTDIEARQSAETFIETRNSVQPLAASWYIDGSFQHADEYEYDNEQKERLIKAWTPAMKKLGVKIPYFLNILVVELTVTGPLLATAHKARKYRLEAERKEILLRQQAARIAKLEKEQGLNNRPTESKRADTQTQWQVDENGYFTRTRANVYIKVGERREKPELTDENYQLLVKHNGKERIDKIFNI